MLIIKTRKSVALLLMGVACAAAPRTAAFRNTIQLTGAIGGRVSDPLGTPQMGAVVALYNRQDRVFEKVYTNELGEFRFAGLTPDTYSVRVTLATFLPAFKRGILVQPGMRSVLNVNLNSLLSTIQLQYPTADNGLMSDDWKWVLRSATATRPVLRFLGEIGNNNPGAPARSAAFSDTRGIVRVSAGEGSLVTGTGNQANLGTTFAVATSLYGSNQFQLAGNLGYGSLTGIPTAAFRTSYSRDVAGGSPELSLTMRQLLMPARMGAALAGNESALPMLRTMSAAFSDSTEVADNVTLSYGVTMDAVSFVDHLNYFSPYARLTYSTKGGGQLDFTFTSGNARPDLAGDQAPDADLQRGLNNLAVFPNVSLLGGRAKVQRGEEYEAAYSRKVGSRNYQISAYRESVSNQALSIVAPVGLYSGTDVLPDLFTGNSIFNVGNYQSSGYMAAVTQNVGDHITATFMYGSMGGLTADNRELVSTSPDELRSMIRTGRMQAATSRITATAPHAGTHMIASYQWTDTHRWAIPGNVYSTQALRADPGLNIYIRQPIPAPAGLPWRMEATADLRNLLAQGYLPLGMAGGQTVLLMETPRCFRGGLSFIF